MPVGVQRAALELASSLLGSPRVARGAEGGVPGEWHRLREHGQRVLLYLHGGGYSLGSPRTHRHLVARLARAIDAQAFVLAYRLAPEHAYPAALDDAIAAYRSLTERFDEIVVAGDSAGGGLTLALAIRARDHGLRPPAALGLICPWLDLIGPHRATGDPLITPSRLEHWKDAYAPAGRTDPGVSPVFAELAGLPPIVLHSAGDDPLLADAEKLASKVNVEHRCYPGQFHAFHALTGLLAEADAALDTLAESLRPHLRADASTSLAA
jgi:acetyl esterase/lipase